MNVKQQILGNNHLSRESIALYLDEVGLLLAVLAGSAAILAGLGTRWGFWPFSAGFTILRWGAGAGALAFLVSLAGAVATAPGTLRNGILMALAGMTLGLFVAGVPLSWMRTAQRLPVIHDITTDMANPPVFQSILPLRAGAPNSAEYGGPVVAAKQREAYPDIGPAYFPAPTTQAFASALSAANAMGWKIVAASAAEGRIEATATTFWFGFKDDVVVRITPASKGSRIDVRSVSRVGRSDVGANAKRIREFLHMLPGAGG